MSGLFVYKNGELTILQNVSFIDKLSFTKHVSIMIRSGITITDAIETLIPDTKNPYFKTILSDVLADIENGQPLSKALARYPKVFDALYINLVQVGEESGTLDENLTYLATKLTKEYALRKKIQNVMIYPTLVIVVGFVIGGYISIFVLPQLINFFDSLNAELPLSTKILIAFASVMKSYGILIFTGIFIGFFVARYLLNSPSIKPIWHNFLLKIPVFGKFMQSANMASFARNLGVMIKSGLSIITALEVEEKATDNLVFKLYIHKIRMAVMKGKSMASELSNGQFQYIPTIATKMIAVGEKTGKLDESLIYLGDFFEDEVDSTAKNFSTILEPVIFIVIGLMIAFLAFSIISPIYQLTGSIHR